MYARESILDITQACKRDRSVDIKNKVIRKGLDHSIKMDLNLFWNGPVFLTVVDFYLDQAAILIIGSIIKL